MRGLNGSEIPAAKFQNLVETRKVRTAAYPHPAIWVSCLGVLIFLLSQHKRSQALCTNPKYQDHHQHLPTQSDITGQRFGSPPFAWDPDTVVSQAAASLSHTYIVAPRRHLLPSSPWWIWCDSSAHAPPPHTHTTFDITGLPPKTKPSTSALTACTQEQLSLTLTAASPRHKPPPHKPYYRVNCITLGLILRASESSKGNPSSNQMHTCHISQISELLCQQLRETGVGKSDCTQYYKVMALEFFLICLRWVGITC